MRHWITRLGTWTSHPAAFVIVGIYGVLWVALGHFDWHSGATLATWLMTLLIQRAEHRDTQAIHAKLDGIIHASGGARNDLAELDGREPEEIEQHRAIVNSRKR